ncbi:hypothetical protein ACQWF5_25360, partial [Salmonella enterica subsp. enterica serovar Infantis]
GGGGGVGGRGLVGVGGGRGVEGVGVKRMVIGVSDWLVGGFVFVFGCLGFCVFGGGGVVLFFFLTYSI